jgi:hypothetical protein
MVIYITRAILMSGLLHEYLRTCYKFLSSKIRGRIIALINNSSAIKDENSLETCINTSLLTNSELSTFKNSIKPIWMCRRSGQFFVRETSCSLTHFARRFGQRQLLGVGTLQVPTRDLIQSQRKQTIDFIPVTLSYDFQTILGRLFLLYFIRRWCSDNFKKKPTIS